MSELALYIVNLILMVVAALFANYYHRVKMLLSAIEGVIDSVRDALRDDKITEDEAKAILKNIEEILNVLKK